MGNAPLPLLWWFKAILVVASVVFGVFYTLPTFFDIPGQKINLGLDLRGGVSLTLEVDVEGALQDALNRSLERANVTLQEQGLSVSVPKVNLSSGQNNISVALTPDQQNQVRTAILDQTALLLADGQTEQGLTFRLSRTAVADFRTQVVDQALTTLRNRIDQFGVAEPSLFKAGDNRIVVELPGVADISRAKSLLGNTAQLDFRLVSGNPPAGTLLGFVEEAKKSLNLGSDAQMSEIFIQVSEWLRQQKRIPENTTVLPGKAETLPTAQNATTVAPTYPYLVERFPKLTGDMLQDAQAIQSVQDFVPQSVVTLKFKPQGAKLFGELTTEAFKAENAPHQIAIVLDGVVQSAPVVNGPIVGGDAQITMGSGGRLDVQLQQAQDLALVLRSGALPAQVRVIEERQIGPTEGARNIFLGVVSTLVAAALVVILMIVIYGVAGIVANIAMFLNVILILALLALLGATLTLPGIAGIVLTLAIAVDGNVVINERIREEIQSGAHQRQAFYRGYHTSFRTLIDAHITSAVAGFVLILYGNPTVKGFAVTLLCGILCTLFTSYYVTEVIGQWLVEKTKMKRFG